MSSTACDNLALVEQALREAGGDVDAAIERVIEIIAEEDEEAQADADHVAVEASAAESQEPAGLCHVVLLGSKPGTTTAVAASGGVINHESAIEISVSVGAEPAAAASEPGHLVSSGDSYQAGSSVGQPRLIELKLALDSSQRITFDLLYPSCTAQLQASAACTSQAMQQSVSARSSDAPSSQDTCMTVAVSSSVPLEVSSSSASVSQPTKPSAAVGVTADSIQDMTEPTDSSCSAVPKHQQHPGSRAGSISKKPAQRQKDAKASRNKACPCGSGKKYKSCCGVAAAAAERRRKVLQDASSSAINQEAVAVQIATLCI